MRPCPADWSRCGEYMWRTAALRPRIRAAPVCIARSYPVVAQGSTSWPVVWTAWLGVHRHCQYLWLRRCVRSCYETRSTVHGRAMQGISVSTKALDSDSPARFLIQCTSGEMGAAKDLCLQAAVGSCRPPSRVRSPPRTKARLSHAPHRAGSMRCPTFSAQAPLQAGPLAPTGSPALEAAMCGLGPC